MEGLRRLGGVLRRAWPWLRIVVGLGIVAALVLRLGARTFLDGLHVINTGAVFAALAIGLATTVLSAARWRMVARGVDLELPLGSAVASYYRAVFLNSVLPAGVLGDVHRAVDHGRQEGDVGRSVRAVVLERVAGQVVLVAAGVVALLFGPVVASVRDMVVIVLAIAAGLLLVLVVFARRRLRQALAGLRAVWPGVLALSVAALAGHVTLFVVAARAAGSTASVGALVPLVVLSLLAMSVPLNVGGWGPREGVAALVFGAAGVGAAVGLTAAVAYGVLALVSTLPGAGVLLVGAAREPRQQRQEVGV
jgi:uncharacterized membrane protein YbhN (UPF0104 family)